MKYKIREQYENTSLSDAILLNRGIDIPSEYLSLDDSSLHSYSFLDNINDAVQLLLQHIENKSNIGIIVDSDCDGYCSASILYTYLSKVYDKSKLIYFIHAGKQHGLSDDIVIDEGAIDLLFIPDGGSNDTEQCGLLKANDIDIIILDHHEIEKENNNAVIVNPYNCEYPNKELSGAGVTYKFLKAVDDALWETYADDGLDLVALSIISDSMSLKSHENKRLVDVGLLSIKNSFLNALINKQSYSMKDHVNIINLMFYVNPLINGLIRAGLQEEKEMMFEAFIGSDKTYEYKKRNGEIIQEETHNRVARLCTNAKSRQNRVIKKEIEKLDIKIKEENWDEDKIMLVRGDGIDKNLTGLIAMKLARKYNKPCLLLRKNNHEGKINYSGSGRNIDCDIVSLKDFLAETGYFDLLQGHADAFGAGIPEENIEDFLSHTNKKLKNFDFTKTHLIDFIFDFNEINFEVVKDVHSMSDHYGKNIDECIVLVDNIEIEEMDIEVFGKKVKNNIAFENSEGVRFIKFKCNEDDALMDISGGIGDVSLKVIGKPNVNEYDGKKTAQVIIKDYEIIEEN